MQETELAVAWALAQTRAEVECHVWLRSTDDAPPLATGQAVQVVHVGADRGSSLRGNEHAHRKARSLNHDLECLSFIGAVKL